MTETLTDHDHDHDHDQGYDLAPATLSFVFPESGTRVLTTCRGGGVSTGAFAAWNLAEHVGDDPAAVATNRARLSAVLPRGLTLPWLTQIHGTQVLHASEGLGAEADGVWSDDPTQGCVVMTADCLPVVFAAKDGQCVATAHAGWRGLVAGILPATLEALPVPAAAVSAWLGPAIGPTAFEVGDEVREAFLSRWGDAVALAFVPAAHPGKWLADLYALARQQLGTLGVAHCYGGDRCTFTEAETFYSYRREGATGRMATVAWLAPKV